MTSLERLIRTHPIWFLPRVGRDDTVELLRGKEAGVRCYPKLPFIMLRLRELGNETGNSKMQLSI